MQSFKTYLQQPARLTTHAEVVAAIAGFKKASEIMNPLYINLVDQAKRVMNHSSSFMGKPESILNLLKDHRDAVDYREDSELLDLYYTSFDGFTSHGKIEKLADKLAKKNIPAYKTMLKEVREYLSLWKQVGIDLKELKTKVVKTTQKREEAKAVAVKALAKQFTDSSSLITVFENHLNEYKKMAEKRAREFVDTRIEMLKKHGMDLNKAAPSPNGYSHDYKTALAKRSSLSSISRPHGVDSSRGENIRLVDRAKIERFVEMNVQGAEEAYRSFMGKMITKIGKPVVKATMLGNIWTNAVLRVTTNDGEEQRWDTKMILNFSKYQKMFNQFPSRQVK